MRSRPWTCAQGRKYILIADRCVAAKDFCDISYVDISDVFIYLPTFVYVRTGKGRGQGSYAVALGIVQLQVIQCVNNHYCVFVQIGCRANYTFIQTFHSYVNPLRNRANGICCDNPSLPPCDTTCDNMFTVCVANTGQPLPEVGNIRSEDCPLGFFLSRTIPNRDNITFNTSAPVVFTGDIWPVRYQ